MSGKALRSAAFLNAKTGRSFSVALDHGMQLGPVPGLNQARPIIKAAVKLGAEGLLLTLKPGEVADLIRYLRGERQAPLP